MDAGAGSNSHERCLLSVSALSPHTLGEWRAPLVLRVALSSDPPAASDSPGTFCFPGSDNRWRLTRQEEEEDSAGALAAAASQ